MTTHLEQKKCQACEGMGQALNAEQIEQLKTQINHAWQVLDDHKRLQRTLTFKNYYQTIAFVNALAWLAQRENHHPDLVVTYNSCEINWTTHALKGLSLNDFICAAKTDALVID